MKLNEFKTCLTNHPQSKLRFRLPKGTLVPAHAHVTEVARIDKRYVDCGGTLRTDVFCRLQTWVADDVEHRLSAGKMFGILGKAASFLGTDDLEVDVEYEDGLISQYPVEAIEADGDELILKLGIRHTACLAEDKCLPSKPRVSLIDFKPLPRFK